MKSAKFFTLVVLTAFISGIIGNIFSDRFISPRVLGQNAALPSQPVVEQQKVVEKLAESSIIQVAKDVSPAVVSIIVSKNLPQYYTNPYDLFYNPFGFDPFGSDPFSQLQPRQQIVPRQRQSTPEPQPTPQAQKVGAGTGFIVTSDGLVMTNKHVVEDTEAEYTIITKDGTEYDAEVVTRDPSNDMAFVRMKNKKTPVGSPSPSSKPQSPSPKTGSPSADSKSIANMPVVKFVSDNNTIQVGQQVVAIGNALGQFDNTVTTGVVSAKGREISASAGIQSEQLKGLLQTDASINPGNSGGPLVDLSGEVIGMNTAVASGQGIGFSIPLDQKIIGRLLDQINKYGKIIRPYLGVRYIQVTPEINKQYNLGTDDGAWIKSGDDLPAVMADTPASRAGLKGGDIVLKVNDKAIDKKTSLQDLLAESNPGDTITLTILRDGKNQDLKVELEQRQEDTAATPTPKLQR